MGKVKLLGFTFFFLAGSYAYAQDFVLGPDPQNQVRAKVSPRKGEVNAGTGYGQTDAARWGHTWVQGAYYLLKEGKHLVSLTTTASLYGGRSLDNVFEFGGEKILFGPTYQLFLSKNHLITTRVQYGIRTDRGSSASYHESKLTHILAPFISYSYHRKTLWLPNISAYSLAEVGLNRRKDHYVTGLMLDLYNLSDGIFRPGFGFEGGLFNQEQRRYDVTPIAKANMFWGIVSIDYRYGILSRAHSVNISLDIYEFFQRVL